MLDLPDQPLLDKHRLVGGCVRLPLRIDADRLQAEMQALPEALWDGSGGRVGVHRAAAAIFLRGYAPAEGDKPIEDRAVLERLPYARELIERTLAAPPQRCLLARLPPGAIIAPHMDQAPYFAKTLRVHVPVVSNARVHMLCAGRFYAMRPGEAWSLNNVAVHAAWNAHEREARTHLIADFLPSPVLLEWLRLGERDLGSEDAGLEQEMRRALAAKGQRAAQA